MGTWLPGVPYTDSTPDHITAEAGGDRATITGDIRTVEILTQNAYDAIEDPPHTTLYIVSGTSTPPPDPPPGDPETLYVSPAGGGDGLTADTPTTIAAALAVATGELTILCLTGTYPRATINRAFTTFRSAPGHWAIFETESPNVDPVAVTASNVTVEHVGAQCTAADRWDVYRNGSISANGDELVEVHIRNCVVLDGGNALEHWATAQGSLYGNLALDNGWDDEVRGHGHGTYTQNLPGSDVKVIRHNVFAHMFSTGIKTGTNASYVDHYRITENVVVNPGAHSMYGSSMWGTAFNHYAYHHGSSDNEWVGNVAWGGGWANNGVDAPDVHDDVTVTNNWIRGGFGLSFGDDITNLMCTGNTVWSPENTIVQAADGLGAVDLNAYFGDVALTVSNAVITGSGFRIGGTTRTFAQWKAGTVYDDNSTHSAFGVPDAMTQVFANEYENGRALVVVFNPSEAETVDVDCSGIIGVGESWWVFNALNPYAGAVASGTGPTVTVPMTVAAAGPCRTPAGLDPAVSALPEFGVFVVRQVGATWVAPT